MALSTSGPIRLTQIQAEFGGANPISLGEYYRNGVYVTSNNTVVPTSGAISLGNFYGTTNQFAFTISTDQTNANLRTLAIAAGWNQASQLVVTINSGVYISSNTTATPALTVSGSFPAGVLLTNDGIIVGMGGAGGSNKLSTNGSAGGTAFSVSSTITVTNNGTIAGGGGGGGGGGGAVYNPDPTVFGYGGGGGGGRSSNAANSAGGAAGGETSLAAPFQSIAGSAGTVSAAGAGGRGHRGGAPIGDGGTGGTGGGWGAAGSTGAINTGEDFSSTATSPTSGGAAGAAVSGNSNITWIATGTRLGGIS